MLDARVFLCRGRIVADTSFSILSPESVPGSAASDEENEDATAAYDGVKGPNPKAKAMLWSKSNLPPCS